ncbi:hypothetical protein GUJ93_ZPchr0003g18274 [Zizania palustris]|uniref:Uncharacterized protein n=1 Tax=Zizania palustris TaxID=103762 RepID=A0A8J5VWH6_ZIZPA|nr:hypothetical protein GUJ93_ZPchr0003g18274 [Zizania palustris]
MASALTHVGVLFVLQILLFPLLSSAQSAISLPPSSAPTASPDGVLQHPDSAAADALAPSQPPSGDEPALSPPAPPETSPFPAPSEPPVPHSAAPAPSSVHSITASAPAPSAAKDEDDDSKDEEEEEEHSSPAPAPAAEEIKAAAAGDKTVDGESERHGDQLNGGKKAGVVVGAFTAAAVVGLAAFVWKKRQANIRRSRYADYSARLELV